MRAILFDLDNTLYNSERALFSLIDVRINHYMQHVVGIAADKVDGLRRRYWQQYGVTLQGLILEHGADPEDYLDYVHDIDVASRLQANLPLRQMLHDLPQRKFVFTNGSHAHAMRVLQCLQIEDCFEHIFDIRLSNYIPKPNRLPYEAVLGATGLSGENCVMVEDSVDNLHMAAQLGMKTILVQAQGPEAVMSDQPGAGVSPGAAGTSAAEAPIDAIVERAEQVGDVIQDWMKSTCGQ